MRVWIKIAWVAMAVTIICGCLADNVDENTETNVPTNEYFQKFEPRPVISGSGSY